MGVTGGKQAKLGNWSWIGGFHGIIGRWHLRCFRMMQLRGYLLFGRRVPKKWGIVTERIRKVFIFFPLRS